MDTSELFIWGEHPPHPSTYKRIGLSLLRIFLGIALLAAFLSLHISHSKPEVYSPSPGFQYFSEELQHAAEELHPPPDLFQEKEKAIQEIRMVLEKYPTGLAKVTQEEIAEVIYEEATRYNQDPKFILALIATESSFQNWSVSEQGAKGLMQIMPFVARSLAEEMGIEWSGDRTLFNPFLNIRMGIYYLSQLTTDFDDFRTALAAYNYGPTYIKSLIEKKEQIPADFYHKLLNVYESL